MKLYLKQNQKINSLVSDVILNRAVLSYNLCSCELAITGDVPYFSTPETLSGIYHHLARSSYQCTSGLPLHLFSFGLELSHLKVKLFFNN